MNSYPDLIERTKGVSEPWSGLTTIFFTPRFWTRSPLESVNVALPS